MTMHDTIRKFTELTMLSIMGLALTACAYVIDWNGEVSGVPLDELDLTGDPPSIVELAGPDQVILTQADSLSIEVAGNSSAGQALRFDRDDSSLTIARDSSVYDGSAKAFVRIAMPAPSSLEIAGSGAIEAETMPDDASIEVAGSGSIVVRSIAAQRLSVEIAGSGDVEAAGSARVLDIEIAGSGDVRLTELTADDVTVEIAGSGDVDIASDGRVSAEIAGSGDVTVTGSASCSLDSAGSGSLNCRPRQQANAAE